MQQRLLKLIEKSGAILGSPKPETVLPGILSLAREFVAADGFAVWRFDRVEGRWDMAAQEGLSAGFAESIVPPASADDVLAEPIAAEDVMRSPLLAARQESYAREGVRAMLAIPLSLAGEMATLVFYYRHVHPFSEQEMEIGQAIGALAAAALRTAQRYGEQRTREQQALFLARVSSALAESLDYVERLKTIARLAVPEVADWCAVDMIADDGSVNRLAVTHTDPNRVRLAEEFARKYPPDREATTGLWAVLRTGRSELLPHLTDAMIDAAPIGDDQRDAIRELRITSYMIVPLKTRRGIVGAITFVSAESRRHYGEADLTFAETLADRTAAAIENAFAYEAARTANAVKDQFLATLSHELRTPLNAVAGYARMLVTGQLPPDLHAQAVEVIDRNAAVLTDMVEDLLDISRIISGKLRLETRLVSLAEVARNAVGTVTPQAASKGVHLEASIRADDVMVHADPERLQQVIWNLLANAVKFTPQDGCVSLSLSLADGVAELCVRDTGRGIDRAFLPYLFDPFRQADTSPSRDKSGLGLGLAIARQIVEMHGGSIEAHSDGINRGATFRVRLPVVAADV